MTGRGPLRTVAEKAGFWTVSSEPGHPSAPKSPQGPSLHDDVSDEEVNCWGATLPAPCLTGRPRAWPMREIVKPVILVLRSGCAWRLLPDSFPPRQTVYGWFLRLRDDCVLERLNHHLVMLDRARSGRAASPSAGVLDGAKTSSGGDQRAGGYDLARKEQGRQAPASVDRGHRRSSPWCWSLARPTSALRQRPVLAASRHAFPFIAKVFADRGYAGKRVAGATAIAVEIVRRTPTRSASPSSPGAGSSSASSPGSAATAASPRTSRRTPEIRRGLPLRRLHHLLTRRLARSRCVRVVTSRRLSTQVQTRSGRYR